MAEAPSGSLDLPEAPTFYPTEEEFKDPLAFIAKIRAQAERYGLAKIVPPPSFQPPFAIDRRCFRFRTRVQAVNELQEKSSNSQAVRRFWEDYAAFLQRRGQRHRKQPTYAGQEVDLYRLYRLVQRRGGYQAVTGDKSWREVATVLQLQDKAGNVAYSLRQLYQKLLLPYEDYCRMREGGQYDLLGAVLDAELGDIKDEPAEGQKEEIGEDEAAEILEGLLGLGPPEPPAPPPEPQQPPKKKQRKTEKQERQASPAAALRSSKKRCVKVPDNIFTLVCEKCKGGHYEDKIILCDRCDKGWHMFCLSPAMEKVPDGEWVCPSCIAADFEGYAFKEGEDTTLEDFEKTAHSFERQWFGSEARASKASVEEKEAAFWKIVEDGEDAVEVLYGADLDTTEVGSGFPRLWEPQATEDAAGAARAGGRGVAGEAGPGRKAKGRKGELRRQQLRAARQAQGARRRRPPPHQQEKQQQQQQQQEEEQEQAQAMQVMEGAEERPLGCANVDTAEGGSGSPGLLDPLPDYPPVEDDAVGPAAPGDVAADDGREARKGRSRDFKRKEQLRAARQVQLARRRQQKEQQQEQQQEQPGQGGQVSGGKGLRRRRRRSEGVSSSEADEGESDSGASEGEEGSEGEGGREVEEQLEAFGGTGGGNHDSALVPDPKPDPYALSPWNLNNIPHLGGEYSSLLRVIEGKVPGVTVPWVYVGMLFSSFCWHVEDHQFYSINYHHWGAPKRWYSVPAAAAGLFEAAFRAALPQAFRAQPDLLFQLVTMLSPRILTAHGVPVCCATQEAGQFIVTFPGAYHGGFNCGVNCAEAVNLAPADWLRFGASSLARYRRYKRPCVVSHEEMLLKVARSDHGPLSSYWVQRELRRVVEEEQVMRAKLWAQGLRRSRLIPVPVGMKEGDTEDAECAICHLYLHLSAVECDCCPGRYVCLHHAAGLCECATSRRRLAYRHTLQQLEEALGQVAARVAPDFAAERDAEEAALAGGYQAGCGEVAVKQEDGPGANGLAMATATVKEEEEEEEGGDNAQAEPGGGEEEEGSHLQGEEAEAEEDLADLVGFMAEMAEASSQGGSRGSQEVGAGGQPGERRRKGGKRSREDSEGAGQESAPLAGSAVMVVPPPEPYFQHLEITAEDEASLPDWLQRIAEGYELWAQRAEAVVERGGRLAEDMEDLLAEGEQYLWGAIADVDAARATYSRLKLAADYVNEISSALKSKPTLEQVQELLAREPLPLPDPPGLDRLREVVQLAHDWLAKAKDFAGDKGAPIEMRALEHLVNEAARMPVTLAEARSLRERLAAARKLGESIRAALPTSGRRSKKDEGPLTLDRLKALRSQAAALRCDMPEVGNLALALERLDAWQARFKALAGMRAPLGALEELLGDSEALPALMPEADALRALIDKGHAWRRQSEALLGSRAPLKRMRDVLHAGLRLPVEMPEVETLRQGIRRREWEETARKALGGGKHTLHGLLEVLATAPDMGADDSPLALHLRSKVEAAEGWDAKAQAFVDHARANPSARPSIAELRDLVAEGLAVGIKMDRLQQLNHMLTAAMRWVAKAQHCLPAPAPAPSPPAPAPPSPPTRPAQPLLASQPEEEGGGEERQQAQHEGEQGTPAAVAAAVQVEAASAAGEGLGQAEEAVAAAQAGEREPEGQAALPPSGEGSGGAIPEAMEVDGGALPAPEMAPEGSRLLQPEGASEEQEQEQEQEAGEPGTEPRQGCVGHELPASEEGVRAEGQQQQQQAAEQQDDVELPGAPEGSAGAEEDHEGDEGEDEEEEGGGGGSEGDEEPQLLVLHRPKRRRQPSNRFRELDLAVDEEREAWEAQHGGGTAEQPQHGAEQAQHAAAHAEQQQPQQAAQQPHHHQQQQQQRRGAGGRGKKAEQVPRGPPQLEALEGLLAEYDGLVVASEEADGLRALHQRANAWLDTARPVLEQDYVTDDQLPLLLALIAAGEEVGVAMEQLEILKANVEALGWGRRVRQLLARLPAFPASPGSSPATEGPAAAALEASYHDAAQQAGQAAVHSVQDQQAQPMQLDSVSAGVSGSAGVPEQEQQLDDSPAHSPVQLGGAEAAAGQAQQLQQHQLASCRGRPPAGESPAVAAAACTAATTLEAAVTSAAAVNSPASEGFAGEGAAGSANTGAAEAAAHRAAPAGGGPNVAAGAEPTLQGASSAAAFEAAAAGQPVAEARRQVLEGQEVGTSQAAPATDAAPLPALASEASPGAAQGAALNRDGSPAAEAGETQPAGTAAAAEAAAAVAVAPEPAGPEPAPTAVASGGEAPAAASGGEAPAAASDAEPALPAAAAAAVGPVAVPELPELILPEEADAVVAAAAAAGGEAGALANKPADERPSLQALLLQDEEEAAAAAGRAGGVPALAPATEAGSAPEAVPCEDRPSLDEAWRLLEEGSVLPCDEPLYHALAGYVEAGQAWEDRAQAVLAAGGGAGLGRESALRAGATIQLKELREMLARSEALGLLLPSLPRLQALMRVHQQWEQRVRELLQTAGPRPSFQQLVQLAHEARASPVSSNLRRRIDEAVHKSEEWVEECRRCIAKRNSPATLPQCLTTLSHSVDCAVEQFERRLEVEKRLVASGSHLPPGLPEGGGSEEDEKELYCLCQQPYNVDTSMISCDLCGEWYHMRCVGVTQSQARTLKKYTCPVCVAVKGNLDVLDQVLNRLRKTKRPEKDELLELLGEVRTLPVAIEEESALEKILTKFDRWATATNRAVEVHDASRLLETQGQILPLSDGMLHQLCKSALAMEIDGTEYAEKILRLLRCNKWRVRAEQLAAAPGKPTVEAVAKMLAEGERMGINAEVDVVGARLAQAQALTKQWQETCRDALAKLKEVAGSKEFDAWVKRANEVAKEAECLPLRVDRDLDSLQECSKLYCLCRKPYDEQRPMLGCDYCQDWFHYECVGLRAPGEPPGPAGDDYEPPPEDFRCPICCMKSGVKYPHFHRLPTPSMDALKKAALHLPPPPPMAAPPAIPRELLPPPGVFQPGFHPFVMPPPRGAVPAALPPPMIPGMLPPAAAAFAAPGMMEMFQGAFPPLIPGMPPVNIFGYPASPELPQMHTMLQQHLEVLQPQQAQQAPHGTGEGRKRKRAKRATAGVETATAMGPTPAAEVVEGQQLAPGPGGEGETQPQAAAAAPLVPSAREGGLLHGEGAAAAADAGGHPPGAGAASAPADHGHHPAGGGAAPEPQAEAWWGGAGNSGGAGQVGLHQEPGQLHEHVLPVVAVDASHE